MNADLGETYRYSVTGFVGVATSRSEKLHGPTQVLLEAERIGATVNELWVYEGRLEPPRPGETGFGRRAGT